LTVQEYIAELLFDYNRLIIPNFGAFIGTPRSAKIDKAANKVLPPSKDILFNDKLNVQDELLVSKISEQEGIVKQAAVEKIDLFINELKEKLEKDKSVSFNNLGTFVQKPSGEIVFNQDESVNFLNDAYGLNPVDLPTENKSFVENAIAPPTTQTEEEVTPEVIEENIEQEVATKEIEVDTVEEKTTAESKKEDIQTENIEEEVTETVETSQPIEPEKVEVKEEPVLQEAVADVVDDESGFKWWYAVLPLLALLIGGFFVWQLISKGSENPYAKKEIPKKVEQKKATTTNTPVVTDSVKAKVTTNDADGTKNQTNTKQTIAAKEKTIKKETRTQKTQSSTSTKSTNNATSSSAAVTSSFSPVRGYYVIIGSIKGKSTAEDGASKWKKKGYEAHVLPGPNGYSRIGLYVGTDKQEASSKLAKYKSDIISSAWLLQN